MHVEHRDTTVMKNCIFPNHLLYDVDRDLWAEQLSDGSVRMGLTDVGQTAGGKLQVVSFPRSTTQVGHRVAATKTLAMMESAKWIGVIRAPVAGVLVAVNLELTKHPLLVNLDPYTRGWILEFKPDEQIRWMRGEEAQNAYLERLKSTFRSVAGVNEDFWCVHCNDWDEL